MRWQYRRTWSTFCASVLAFALLGAEARAHFLFVRIAPLAEGGRWAEVYFSDQAEVGDPKFVDKIAGTQLWWQNASAPGEFIALRVHKVADRLRAAVPGAASGEVIGACEYGVLARPDQKPFLLRHYPKALVGRPDELNRLAPRPEAPVEIQATIKGSAIHLVALGQGRLIPGAVFHAVNTSLEETELKAGPDGQATWTPAAPGRYAVYTQVTTPQTGSAGGKAYEEIRDFATLALAWPLVRPASEADPQAVALFEDALAARAAWGDDFPGFAAHLAGSVDGRPFTGSVTVRDDGSVQVEADDPVARPWLQGQLESLVMHRLADNDGADRTRPVVRFLDDDEDDQPLGRLLGFVGGQFASSYRVKDRQIRVVNRHMGKRNMTITVLDNDRNPEGRFLPRSYLVQYWDASSGTLDHVETVQERWQRFQKWDLPTLHTVTDSSSAGFSVKSVTLSEHRLLEVK